MKTNRLLILCLLFLGLFGYNNSGVAVTHTIQVSNFSFTPQNVTNVQLGDIIRWQWSAGVHTTTSSTIPAGASSWDALISSGNTFYEYTPTVAGTYNYVCTPHIGLGMIGSFTVVGSGPTATKVRVETAANGSGIVVPAQSLASGTSITVYAISRDASNAFVANVSASAWSLENITGGVIAGDLVVAANGKSATFTAHVTGTLNIKATSGALTPTTSGLITVTNGPASKINVETAANGTGTIVPAQSLTAGASLSVYAISRDASNNFIANVAATAWSLENLSGGVVAGDLVAAADGKSATFTAHVNGNARIKATSGALTANTSGLLTVTSGTEIKIIVETAANGTGTAVPAQSMNSGSSLTVYAISRDAFNNFVANVAASAWSLENISGNVVAGDLFPSADAKSATFTAYLAGTTTIACTSGTLVPTGSGVITVIVPGAYLEGVISYKNTASTPIKNSVVVLKQNGVEVAQTTTDILGFYSFSDISAGTYTIVCNITKPWGGVNSADALKISKSYVGQTPLIGLNLKVADLNGSNSVNSLDALLASRRFSAIITSFSVGDWQTEANSITMLPGVDQIVNLKVLCSGDVDGSYIPQ